MSNGEEVNQSQITQTRAPSFFEPSIQHATNFATGQFARTPDKGRLQADSRNLALDTIQGKFLSPDTNPFLQGTFDRAADTVQNRLDTQFAGAGRNIGASLPVAKQDLSDLATGIFGGNFQAERDRQVNTLGMSSQFDPLNQFIQRLGALGPLAGRDTSTFGNTEHSVGALESYLDLI